MKKALLQATIATALVTTACGALWAQGLGAPDRPLDPANFATGAEPIDPATYEALPKARRFRAFLGKKVDIGDLFPPPANQGAQPSCVAWATTYAARSYLIAKGIGKRPALPDEIMSPAYVFNSLRKPGPNCNSPITIKAALDFLHDEGVVSLADYPYHEFSCPFPQDSVLAEKATRYRIGEWRAIDRQAGDAMYWNRPIVLDDVKGAVARGAPVVFAMPTTLEFLRLAPGTIYKTDVKDPRNYHAMVVIGYDEDKQAVRIQNSWGKNWADGGYGWIDYETFKLLVGEAYALESPVNVPAPAPALTPQQRYDSLKNNLACANVTVTQDKGKRRITGFAGDAKAIDELRAAALALDPATIFQVAHHPWPQCEAEMTLADALVAGDVTIAATTGTGQSRGGDPVEMKAGDQFGVVAQVSAARPYLSIIYLQADGSAVQLYSGKPDPDGRKRRIASIGMSGTAQDRFEVGPPYGDEIMIALSSAQPLFGAEMADYGTERQFLTALRARLVAAPRGSVAAAVLRLRTKG